MDMYVAILPAFLTINGITLFAWAVISRLTLNKELLLRKGFSEEYAEVHRRQHGRWNLLLLIVFLGSQVLMLGLLPVAGVEVTTTVYLDTILLAAIGCMALAAVAAAFFSTRFDSELKETAKKTGADIVVDFKFTALNMIMNWKSESIAAALIVSFNLRYFGNEPVLYLYVCVPWIYFLTLRRLRYQTDASMKFSYTLMARLIIFFQIFKVLLFALYAGTALEEGVLQPDSPAFSAIILTTVFLTATVAGMVYRYPRLKKNTEYPVMNKEQEHAFNKLAGDRRYTRR